MIYLCTYYTQKILGSLDYVVSKHNILSLNNNTYSYYTYSVIMFTKISLVLLNLSRVFAVTVRKFRSIITVWKEFKKKSKSKIRIPNILLRCLGREFRKSRFELFKEQYDKIMPNDSGGYSANIFEKKLIITNPGLVELLVSKKLLPYFSSRPRSAYLENDHLTHSIFNLDGERWERLRKRLSVAFSNKKLEAMFSQITNCADEISRTLFCGRANNEVEVNEISRTFVMTVFYCCVFGQKIEGIVDSDSKFAKMAKQFRHMDTFRFKFFDMFSCALSRWRPIFGGLINANEATEYFKRLINERIVEKERSGENGHDFLSTFMELERLENSNETYKWDRKATEAHCLVFLLGGFTATSSTIAFTLYELAKNVDVQKKVEEEIDAFLGSADVMSPELIKKMTYLDNVIHESLRKYPPFSANVRICTKKCKMPGENNLTIEKGKTVITPVSGLHYDPKYYPNPERFDPERFDNNGRITLPPCAYLPFGEGTRKCVGQRFAILVVKTVVIKLLSQFHWSIVPGNDTLPNFQPRKFTTTVPEIRLRYELRPSNSTADDSLLK